MKLSDKITSFILFIALFWDMLFFIGCAILGLNFYQEDSNSRVFMYSYALIDVIVMFEYIKILAKYGIQRIDYTIIIIAFVLVFSYYIHPSVFEDGDTLFKSFVAKCIPAMLIASIFVKKYTFYFLCKYIDIFVCLITLGLIVNLPSFLSASGFVSIAGGSYQALSYYAGFSFSITLFNVLYRDEIPHFQVFRTSLFRNLILLFLPIQVLVCIMSGGRGGAILIFLSIVILLYTQNINNKRVIKLKYIIGIGSLSLITIVFFPGEYTERLTSGFERVFSYIGKDGINMKDTANRDYVYDLALKAIGESPIAGYGLYAYVDKIKMWPHNILLEVLLQGGFLYAIVFVIFIIRTIRKLINLIHYTIPSILLCLIFMYPMTYLCFSGSYIATPLFWFSFLSITYYNRTNETLSYI